MARKQSYTDQVKRVEDCGCPIHGVCFVPVSALLADLSFSLVKCARKDCDITAVVEGGQTVRQLITERQVESLRMIRDEMYASFRKELGERILSELGVMALSTEVQLPIAMSTQD